MKPIPSNDPFFISFKQSIDAYSLPERFTFPFLYTPHPLCLIASAELQHYLNNQQEWVHNFGLSEEQQDGMIIGKMFGVLLVKNNENEIGYLAAFSGKLAGSNHHTKFVPPVFDSLSDTGFLNRGMAELSSISEEINTMEALKDERYKEQIKRLKAIRKAHSIALQQKLFDHYSFLNQAGVEKSLNDIFEQFSATKPPSGAGECAAPKLIQYAFQHHMKPLALAEFWWGQSPKSEFWKHGHYYPCCHEKCEPILEHMLDGIEMDERPG